jgi:hypothetical protein
MYLQVCGGEEKGRNTRVLTSPGRVGRGGAPPFAVYFYYESMSNTF